MSLTRFLGATSREALRRVREALGADAMIVSNREVDGGVEIVATNDDAAAAAALPPPPRRSLGGLGASPVAAPLMPTSSPPMAAPVSPVAPATSRLQQLIAAQAQAEADAQSPQARYTLPADRTPAQSAPLRAMPQAPAAGTAPARGYEPPATGTAPVQGDESPASTPVPARADAEDADFLPQFRVPGMPPRMRAPEPEVDGVASRFVDMASAPQAAPMPHPSRLEAVSGGTLPGSNAAEGEGDAAGTVAARIPAPPRSLPLPPTASTAPAAALSGSIAPAASTAPAPALSPVASGDEPPAVLRAIDALQDSLGERIDGLLWRQQAPESPVGLAVYRTLLGAGFSAAIARALATRVPAGSTRDDALEWVRHELAKRLPVSHDESAMFAAGGVFALIGPTGVGKTTTTAKLAARWVMAHGANRVAMLTTDGFRVGAHEQLRIYGRILGVPVLAVNDSEQLQHALRELKDKHVVLIDTVGMSQRDRNLAEQAALLCAAGRPVRRLLLLNAASHGDTLDEVAHAYRQDEAGGLSGCILTKIDEARQLGAALDIAIRHRLPIHYVSDGQRVPENVAQPNAPALVARALSGAASALFAPTEADLAAVWGQAGQALTPVADDPGRLARRQRHLRAALGGLDNGDDTAAAQRLSELAADRTTGLTRQVWRHFHDTGETGALTDLMLADVRDHATQAAGRYVLAWHGRARTAPVSGAERATPGSVLWSEQGAPLAAPARHLVTANGVMATFATEALPPAQGAESATARAAWLDDALPDLRLVHGFDGISVAQAQAWQDHGWAWLARCPAPQRVLWEDTRITVGALAKLLGYAPAGEVWVGDTACTCWVGGAAVELAVPGQSPLPLRLVSMRCVDADGKLHAQAWALTNVSADDIETARVGRWLSQVEAARRAEPWLQTAIEACVRQDADLPALTRGLLAGAQLGLSAWHLSQGPGAMGKSLGLPQGTGPRARRQVLDQMVRVFGTLDMHEDAPAAC